MKTRHKKHQKFIWKIILVLLVVALLIIGGLVLYGNYQMRQIPKLSFKECLEYSLEGEENAVITVGIIQDGKAEFTVYGKDGQILPSEEYTYEIGSLTKTFTAALIEKAISEGKLSLDGTVDQYLKLTSDHTYPTIKELLTHTSGYKDYYFEWPMVGNFFSGRNDFCGITKETVLARLTKLSIPDQAYKFKYSNFNYVVLGLILESVYEVDYETLVNQFALEDLELSHTHISTGQGDLKDYWEWKNADAYLSAGGMTSTISDMMRYAQLQLSDGALFSTCHESLAVIEGTSKNYQMMGIRMDEIGAGWIIDRENEVIWHNGGTGNFNCYVGFQPKTQMAVVILSNQSPHKKIPTTVMGIKLLGEMNRNEN